MAKRTGAKGRTDSGRHFKSYPSKCYYIISIVFLSHGTDDLKPVLEGGSLLVLVIDAVSVSVSENVTYSFTLTTLFIFPTEETD